MEFQKVEWTEAVPRCREQEFDDAADGYGAHPGQGL